MCRVLTGTQFSGLMTVFDMKTWTLFNPLLAELALRKTGVLYKENRLNIIILFFFSSLI